MNRYLKLRDKINEGRIDWLRFLVNEEKKIITIYADEFLDFDTWEEFDIKWVKTPEIGKKSRELQLYLYSNKIPFMYIDWEGDELRVTTEKPATVTIDIFKGTLVKWTSVDGA